MNPNTLPDQLPAGVLARLVDYFLNVFGEVDDPCKALIETLDGDAALGKLWDSEWCSLAVDDIARYLACLQCEAGDVTLRQWIHETYPRIRQQYADLAKSANRLNA